MKLAAGIVVLLVLLTQVAYAITIDGSPDDWATATLFSDSYDQNETTISDIYDIYRYSETSQLSTVYFYFETFDYGPPLDQAWFAIYINSDNDTGTGYPDYPWGGPTGADKRLVWSPANDTGIPPYVGHNEVDLQVWDGGTSSWVSSGRYYSAAWGSDDNDNPANATYMFVEWAMPDSEITSDTGDFTWWVYYNNATDDEDDIAPDGTEGTPGQTPEPATLGLMLLGLVGLFGHKLRKNG